MSENRSPDDPSEASDASRASEGGTRPPADGPAQATNAERRGRRGPPPNPLYHPLFLPVLLIAFTLWFGWDGFLTSDPDMQKHQGFNQIMFGIMAPLCLWMVPRGIREFREDQAAAAQKQSTGKSE